MAADKMKVRFDQLSKHVSGVSCSTWVGMNEQRLGQGFLHSYGLKLSGTVPQFNIWKYVLFSLESCFNGFRKFVLTSDIFLAESREQRAVAVSDKTCCFILHTTGAGKGHFVPRGCVLIG